ncbi:MAG TPA: EthD domain-containing protein [Nocardioides sp.]|jgi:hypothetical protein|uniref:EthD domain-containing protein n=1 Tax=Nocardioides sp. TaxID=35761 RepID=UPI002E33464E|nr:EthD domain-containing protein [Nocardioides sp.]HEX3930012.1 EthD domain-containing protein [Nocardioides sp.]
MTDALTLVIPLRAKDGVSEADFYDYWLNAHITLPPRFPGIDSVYLHQVSFGDSLWPTVAGVSSQPDPDDDFQGVPEATFPTFEDLAAFQAASRVQMEDGINFLSQMIGYAGLGADSSTVHDSTDPAPDGTDSLVRHLVFLRRNPDVSVAEFRTWVDHGLLATLVGSPEILKLRRHLFEELDVTLDHPGVVMTKPLDRQYQAMIEIVVADTEALDRFVSSQDWQTAAATITGHCVAMHAPRVTRCITTKDHGSITLAGVRGVAVADVIRRLNAESQTHDDVLREFLPPADLDRRVPVHA